MTEETIETKITEEEIIIEPDYPNIVDRVKAIFVDSIMMIVFMVLATYIFSMFDNVSDNVRMAAFIFIFFLYDPLFTSVFGGTLGHMAIGIRVKKEYDQTKNIIFPLAIIRFIFKASLGWISLLTVSSSKKKNAIHDLIVGSIVIYKK